MECNKKIVLLGATGRVGAYVALYLKEKGYDVLAVGRRKSDNGFFADYGIPYVSMDIMNQASYNVLPQKDVYGVVHFAADLPANGNNDERQYVAANIYGTMNVLDYCVKIGAEKVIYPRTVADVYYLYGPNTMEHPIDPDSPSHFPLNTDHSIYCITKNAACDIIKHYGAKYGLKFYILRFSNIFVYHPNPTYWKNGVKMYQGSRGMIERAKKGMEIELWGNPECARDVIYVKDLVKIVEGALSHDATSGVYNVGTGKTVTMLEQIQGIIDVFSPKDHPSTIKINRDKPDSPFFLLDIEKTKREFGYEPTWDYISYLKDLKKEMELNRFEKLWGKEEDYLEGTKPY